MLFEGNPSDRLNFLAPVHSPSLIESIKKYHLSSRFKIRASPLYGAESRPFMVTNGLSMIATLEVVLPLKLVANLVNSSKLLFCNEKSCHRICYLDWLLPESTRSHNFLTGNSSFSSLQLKHGDLDSQEGLGSCCTVE
jgi:hypothetical protein